MSDIFTLNGIKVSKFHQDIWCRLYCKETLTMSVKSPLMSEMGISNREM